MLVYLSPLSAILRMRVFHTCYDCSVVLAGLKGAFPFSSLHLLPAILWSFQSKGWDILNEKEQKSLKKIYLDFQTRKQTAYIKTGANEREKKQWPVVASNKNVNWIAYNLSVHPSLHFNLSLTVAENHEHAC